MDKPDGLSIDRELHTGDTDHSDPFGIFHGTIRETTEGGFTFDYFATSGHVEGATSDVLFMGTRNLDTANINVAVERAMMFDPFADPTTQAATTGLHMGGLVHSPTPASFDGPSLEHIRAERRRTEKRRRAIEAHDRKVAKDLQIFDEMQPHLTHIRDPQERWNRLSHWREVEYRGRRAALDSPEAAAVNQIMMKPTIYADGKQRTQYQMDAHLRRENFQLRMDTAAIASTSILGGTAAVIAMAIYDDPNKEFHLAQQFASFGEVATIGGNPNAKAFKRNVKSQYSFKEHGSPTQIRARRESQARARAAKKDARIAPPKPAPKSALDIELDRAFREDAPFFHNPDGFKEIRLDRFTRKGRWQTSLIAMQLRPDQRVDAGQVFGKFFSGHLMDAWKKSENKRSRREMAEVNRLLQSGSDADREAAKTLATEVYNRQRPRFWRQVRKNDELMDVLKGAGLKFGKSKDSAPYYEIPAGTYQTVETVRNSDGTYEAHYGFYEIPEGTRQTVTIEHFERRSDRPARAVDPTNLLLVIDDENSTSLEGIREEDVFYQYTQ